MHIHIYIYVICFLTLVLASILAPRSSNSFTILAFPLFEATCKGVMSFCERTEKKLASQVWLNHCFLDVFKHFLILVSECVVSFLFPFFSLPVPCFPSSVLECFLNFSNYNFIQKESRAREIAQGLRHLSCTQMTLAWLPCTAYMPSSIPGWPLNTNISELHPQLSSSKRKTQKGINTKGHFLDEKYLLLAVILWMESWYICSLFLISASTYFASILASDLLTKKWFNQPRLS